MQITCQSCKSVFAIDDAKVPNKVFAVACPKCKEKITVDPNAQAASPPAAAAAPAPAPAAQAAPPEPAPEKDPNTPVTWGDLEEMRKRIVAEVARWTGGSGSGAPGTFPGAEEDGEVEGANAALVCDDEQMIQQIIADQLKAMGYQVTIAATAEEAQRMAKNGRFGIITVDNRFPDDNEGGLKILNEINNLAAEKRRHTFVAFITADLTTNDQNSAFLLGANITVNKKELKKLQSIIAEGLKNHQKQYRVLEECQREVIRELSSAE